jgi:predicted unusual protein kinase regulating ubiquinone biosynthesis (AarF/ABC1/UbiB family)
MNTLPSPAIDRRRYRIIRRFFLRAIVHFVFWDLILNRPILRVVRTDPIARWKKISRAYRDLAIEMGGVLIKLGQFLSARVDILPREITRELADLRDEVPPVPLPEIVDRIEQDFGRPLSELFSYLSPAPLGSASLGQVHRARLAEDGADVFVKVKRPDIDRIVETDLAAISKSLVWLKKDNRISRRVDLDLLGEEFARVTRNELDFGAEAENCERFRQDFSDEPRVYFPAVFSNYCSDNCLTLENVDYIKISDRATMARVGIDPGAVATALYQLYLRQIFSTYFVHADPHPGNIFVKPLPTEDEMAAGVSGFGPYDKVDYGADRAFQIVFVDFGMVTIIPNRLRAALREYAIGIGTRDAYRMVQSYVSAGTLLPGADLKRLEEAHEALLEQFWGTDMKSMKGIALNETNNFLHEYRDVIYEAPFQFQADMLFAVRAVGILSGISAGLDETFDPWRELVPFAEKLTAEELSSGWRERLQNLAMTGHNLTRLPVQIVSLITQAERGNLTVKTGFTPDSRRLLINIERAVGRLALVVAGSGMLIGAILLLAHDSYPILAWTICGLAATALAAAIRK